MNSCIFLKEHTGIHCFYNFLNSQFCIRRLCRCWDLCMIMIHEHDTQALPCLVAHQNWAGKPGRSGASIGCVQSWKKSYFGNSNEKLYKICITQPNPTKFFSKWALLAFGHWMFLIYSWNLYKNCSIVNSMRSFLQLQVINWSCLPRHYYSY